MNIQLVQLIAALYGTIVIVGGIMGASVSKISLIAGSVCGSLTLLGVGLLSKYPKVGIALILIGAIAPLGRMLPGFLKSHAIWPAGVVSLGAIVTITVTVLSMKVLLGK